MSAPAFAPQAFEPYDGPLADRQVENVSPRLSTSFEIKTDTAELVAFAKWLAENPIYVRVPGEKYLIFGLKVWPHLPREIGVVIGNLLLEPEEQPMGPWNPDGGQMLAWAFSVLDHYGLDYDPKRQGWTRSRQNLIDWYRSDSEPVDWKAVEARLRATGRPVPSDLYDAHP